MIVVLSETEAVMVVTSQAVAKKVTVMCLYQRKQQCQCSVRDNTSDGDGIRE